MKALEKIVDRYLMDGVLKTSPFSENQHAYRKGRSTETALHAVVQRVEKALHYKEVSLALFFDVEGAFDKARTRTIRQELQNRGATPALVGWVCSALKDRSVHAALGDSRLGVRVSGGCPQGSCLSPHLWCLVMDGLLGRLKDAGFYAQAYADDGMVLISGRHINVVCERMQLACRIIEKWCQESGLSVNPAKTEVILFTRRRNLNGLRTPRMNGQSITLVSEVKYLGVILDSKLSWKAQVDKAVNKSVATFWQLRRAVGANWGLSPRITHWLYRAVIRPKIAYGSVVWWPAVERRTTCLRLAKIQRLAALAITGAMRTTPTAALEVLLSLVPLEVWIVQEALTSYLRMRDSGIWKEQGEIVGHGKISLKAEREVPMSSYKIETPCDRLRLTRAYNVTFPSKDQWKRHEIDIPEKALVCYTDGSRLGDQQTSGAGVFLETNNIRRSFPLGKHATVFQAEVYAIQMVASMKEVIESNAEEIVVCSDSQAALRAVCAPRTSSRLVQECGDALERLARSKSVSLLWVPGHSGVEGNEVADELARLGSATPWTGPEPCLGLTRNQVRAEVREWAKKELEKKWLDFQGGRQAKDFIGEPNAAKTNWLLGRDRKTMRSLIGILTGHCHLRRHLALMRVEENATCPLCGEEDETPQHFLGRCKTLQRQRLAVFGSVSLQREDLKGLQLRDILTFLRRSGRFEQQTMGGGDG